jgi:galactokinase
MKVWAPGRINLIGEHTDYSGGLVLPAAIELGLTLEVHRSCDEITLGSTSFGNALPFAATGSGPPARGWARFGQAVAAELDALGRPAVGLECTISSTLPPGVGLSSSAALEVGVAVALCAIADFEIDPLQLADACRRAEQRAVGVPCGILDQAACLLGEQDRALLLDCGSLEHRLIPVPEEVAFIVIDSGVVRQLEHSGYADRRCELEAALARLNARTPRTLQLDDVVLDGLPARRLRHVITENQRVQQFAAALGANDLETAGLLISASHASLRDDYEVSVREVDKLVVLAEDSGALGARLLGGGFGGSVLALAEAGRAEQIRAAIAQSRPGHTAPLIVHASSGAHRVALSGPAA